MYRLRENDGNAYYESMTFTGYSVQLLVQIYTMKTKLKKLCGNNMAGNLQ